MGHIKGFGSINFGKFYRVSRVTQNRGYFFGLTYLGVYRDGRWISWDPQGRQTQQLRVVGMKRSLSVYVTICRIPYSAHTLCQLVFRVLVVAPIPLPWWTDVIIVFTTYSYLLFEGEQISLNVTIKPSLLGTTFSNCDGKLFLWLSIRDFSFCFIWYLFCSRWLIRSTRVIKTMQII